MHSIRTRETRASILSVIMYSLHVVKQVVPPWKSISGKSSLAASVEAKVWAVTMTVHAVSFSLVAKQAGSGGEFLLGASLLSAAEWLQVGIDELAAEGIIVRNNIFIIKVRGSNGLLIVAL